MENITNLTNKDYSSYVTQAQTSNLTNQIKKSTSSEATDEEMLAACKEFEAYLVEQVYKQVQSTIKSDSDEDDNPYADYAYDLQAQQYAKLVSDQGKLGLAQQLYESMKIRTRQSRRRNCMSRNRLRQLRRHKMHKIQLGS